MITRRVVGMTVSLVNAVLIDCRSCCSCSELELSEEDFSLLLQAVNVSAANAAIMNDFFIVKINLILKRNNSPVELGITQILTFRE
jgi:hypothetical protein